MEILIIAAGGINSIKEIGGIGDVIQQRGGQLHWVSRKKCDQLPNSTSPYDGLILCGGELSVHDRKYSAYFNELAQLVSDFHTAGKPIFGSCLGAQTIAYALGGSVFPQGFLEYGFTTLQMNDLEDPLLKGSPEFIHLFELHSDTFTLPPNSARLISGEKIKNQAFKVGERTYGFQCHFEVTPEIVDIWNHRELISSPKLSKAELTSMFEKLDKDFSLYQAEQNVFCAQIINRWLDLF